MLMAMQREALQKAPYDRMSKIEADAYDERRKRIGAICDRLGKSHPSTS